MIVVDIEELRIKYFQNDIPVEYKLNCDKVLKVYPIKTKDWEQVHELSILKIIKNEVNNIDVIQMSYLQFLNEIYFIEYTKEKDIFLNIMCMCFGVEQEYVQFYYKQNKINLVILNENQEIELLINSHDFDDISKIILFQNLYDFDDIQYSKDIREEIEKYVRITNRKNRGKFKLPTLEERKVYLFSKKQMSYADINNMSYRLFSQTYDMLISCEEYLTDKIVQASYKYDVKQNVAHPIKTAKKNILDDIFIDENEIKNKIK